MTSSQPISSYTQVTLGQDWRKQFKALSGRNDDINTSFMQIAANAIVLPTTPTTTTISSNDINDTVAGTGARKYRVTALDGAWNQHILTGDMDGANAVTLVPDLLRVLSVEITECGSTGSNQGNIYVGSGAVTAGVPDVRYKEVTIGVNKDRDLFSCVPSQRKAYITRVNVTTLENTEPLTLQLWTQDNLNSKCKKLIYECNFEQSLDMNFDNFVVNNRVDIWGEVKTESATGVTVNAYIEYVLGVE